MNEQPSKSKLIRNILLTVVYVLAFGVAGAILYRLFLPGTHTLNPSWETVSLGSPAITFDTPVPLAEIRLNLTPEMSQVFQRFQSFGSADNAGVLITATVLEFQPAVVAKTEGEDMLRSDLEQQLGATNIVLHTSESTADSLHVARMEGTLVANNKPHAVSKMSLQRGQHVWNVMVLVPADAKDEAAIRKRIMESVSVR